MNFSETLKYDANDGLPYFLSIPVTSDLIGISYAHLITPINAHLGTPFDAHLIRSSDAQHLSTELSVRFSDDRQAIPAISLVTDTSTLSAIGNDFGFEFLFSRQIEAIGNAGDVAIGITTSGKSKNVIYGLKKAKENGLKCLALTGKFKKDLEKICDQVISIPAKNTSRIQEMHIMIGQMLCNAIEFKLGIAPLVKEEK